MNIKLQRGCISISTALSSKCVLPSSFFAFGGSSTTLFGLLIMYNDIQAAILNPAPMQASRVKSNQNCSGNLNLLSRMLQYVPFPQSTGYLY